MDLGLRGARVVVTGGASNIGRGIVHEFATEGAQIVISDIDGPQAEKVQAEALQKGAAAVQVAVGDLTLPDTADAAIGCAVDRWGGIDVLVNNAGWSVPGFIATDTDRDKWQRTIEINLFTAIAATQAAIGPMKERRRRLHRVHRQRRRLRPDPPGRVRRVEGRDGRAGPHGRA
jgi:2-hydroxycyclohexanecarboxyl-CoA dehydrogenase